MLCDMSNLSVLIKTYSAWYYIKAHQKLIQKLTIFEAAEQSQL